MTSRIDMLVTGSTGMLGQAWMRTATQRGINAVGASRSSADHPLDLRNEADLARILDKCNPDLVVNCAAMTDLEAYEANPAGAHAINASAVRVLGEQCTVRGIRLVQISTDQYFTGDGDLKHDETATVQLVNQYARGKHAAEKFALMCPGSLVLRTNVVGFRGWSKTTFVEWVIESLASGGKMTLFEDFFTSSIDAGSFASAALDLIGKRASGLLNLASSEVSSKQRFIEELAGAFGYSLANATSGSVRSIGGARRAESCGLDVTRAEQLLGYRLPILSQVIEALRAEHGTLNHCIGQTTHAV